MKFVTILYLLMFPLFAFSDTDNLSHWTAKQMIEEAQQDKLAIVIAKAKRNRAKTFRKVLKQFNQDSSLKKNSRKMLDYLSVGMKQKKLIEGEDVPAHISIFYKSVPFAMFLRESPEEDNYIHIPPLIDSGKWLVVLSPREQGGYRLYKNRGAFKIVSKRRPEHLGWPVITEKEIEELFN